MSGVAAIERQFGDALLLNNLLDCGRGHVHLQGVAGNGDDFRRRAQLQAKVHRERLIREQNNSAFLRGAKPGRFYCQVIRCGLQRRNDKKSFGIRHSCAREPRAHLHGSYFGIRDGSAFGVGDPAGDAAETLRLRQYRNQQEREDNEQDMLLHFCLPFRGVPEGESGPAPRFDLRGRQASTK